MLYVIRSEPLGVTVKRRWSEFVWLREALQRIYVGLFIPSLPATSMFSTGSTDLEGDLVKSRIVQLNTFLSQLFSIPFLLPDNTVQSFLTVQGEKDFKNLMDSVSKANPNDDPSPGAIAWKTLIDQEPSSAVAEHTITVAKGQLEQLKLAIGQLQDQVVLLHKASLSVAAEMDATAAQMSVWTGTEGTVPAEMGTSDAPLANPRLAEIRSTLDSLYSSFSHWASDTQVSCT